MYNIYMYFYSYIYVLEWGWDIEEILATKFSKFDESYKPIKPQTG